jgi:hypothetical protein
MFKWRFADVARLTWPTAAEVASAGGDVAEALPKVGAQVPTVCPAVHIVHHNLLAASSYSYICAAWLNE